MIDEKYNKKICLEFRYDEKKNLQIHNSQNNDITLSKLVRSCFKVAFVIKSEFRSFKDNHYS